MDIDTLSIDPKHAVNIMAESSELKQTDEEHKSIDLGDLDIFSLEQACKQKQFDKIPTRQLESLEVILSRAHQQRSLRIQPGS